MTLVGVALVVAYATRPGSRLRTQWDLGRVAQVDKEYVVYLAPGSSVKGNGTTSGWAIQVLSPSQPVWRFRELELRLLPGCEIVLPSGQKVRVSGSAETTAARTFVKNATAAVTVSAVLGDHDRVLVCDRVLVGEPEYGPLSADLSAGEADTSAAVGGSTRISGRAEFLRNGRSQVLVVHIPAWQYEDYEGPEERQYSLLTADTLYLVVRAGRGQGGATREVTLAEAMRVARANPTESVDADIVRRGSSAFVVQLRVKDAR